MLTLKYSAYFIAIRSYGWGAVEQTCSLQNLLAMNHIVTKGMHTLLLVMVSGHCMKYRVYVHENGDDHYMIHHHIVSEVQSIDAHYYCSEHPCSDFENSEHHL